MLYHVLLLAALLLVQTPQASEPLSSQVQLLLRARFPASGAAPRLRLGEETFAGSAGLPCFYERRGYVPAWTADGELRPEVNELLATLARAGEEGLRPEEYRPGRIRQRAGEARSAPEAAGLAELDLLLTDAFLRYAEHVRSGQVNPRKLYRDCAVEPPAGDLPAVLESALSSGSLRKVLAELPPTHEEYGRLREALARYKRVTAAGGWTPVAEGPNLRLGDQEERVAVLRERLAQEAMADGAEPPPQSSPAARERTPASLILQGDPEGSRPDLFDEALDATVRAFQERHGLEVDGVVGPQTLGMLDSPPAEHVREIELNLERWRWLPRELGPRYVLVNIAAFWLRAVEDGRTALAMKVIVGKPYTRTPMFSGSMKQVIFNPSWHVPASIANKEIAPRLRRDPGYLKRENFEVISSGGRSGLVLRQRPGPNNALGRVKFVFPNRFNVYLHDTPARSLFSRTQRTFSHGCIRIEKPVEMAEWVLGGDAGWTPEAVAAAIAAGKERPINLEHPIPVHVAYWTAWVDETGTLQIRRDVYGRDVPLAEALG